MSAKVLIVSSTASMILQFTMRNIALLQAAGYQVTVAANFDQPGTITQDQAQGLKAELTEKNVSWHQVDFGRGVGRPLKNLRAIRQLRDLMRGRDFDFVYTQAALASVFSRLVARYYRLPVLYFAHGFQFYRGGPWQNWCLYYPIEKLLSRWTKVIVTINDEDTQLAQHHFHAGKVVQVPGVGIDYPAFAQPRSPEKLQDLRRSLQLPEEARVLISVGELSRRKNHQLVIRALADSDQIDLHYLIVGIGDQQAALVQLIDELGLSQRVHLLGYRTDVGDLYHLAEVAVFPSRYEGLMVAGMEAMAAGLPLLYAQVRGIADYMVPGQTGYPFRDNNLAGLGAGLTKILPRAKAMGEQAQAAAQQFDYHAIDQQMAAIFQGMKEN
ncbi:glycosyltransferase [Lactobacillaceae bacterium L1_55_11]|nr:glycosyltransferase [Lactobacillaceae bacterium L1_55_11]